MRIAMIGTRGIPAATGGAERVVEALTGELTARGHEVLVYSRKAYVAGRGHPEAGQQIITGGLNGKHTDALTHTLTAMFSVLRRDVDVIHVHSPGPAVWNWIPALAGKPTVLTVHAPDWRRDKWSCAAKCALRTGLWVGMKTTRAVTTVSRPLADELIHRFGRAVTYVPNAPPDVEPVDASEAVALGLQPDGYGLYVGRIVPEKRLHVLLEAWQASGTPATLAVAGEVGTDAYGRQCREAAGPNIRWLGSRHGRELAAIYSHAGAVFQPSVLEGMSLVLLEASAYGRCTVMADINENRSALGESGFYHKADDVADLANAINRCMSSADLRRSRGEQALQYVREHYCWPAVAEQMEAIYTDVARTSTNKVVR